jgi:glycogen(starch) synthase
VLIPDNALWKQLVEVHAAGRVVGFAEPVPAGLAGELAGRQFYARGIPEQALWASEARKLWALLDTIR